MNSTESTMHAQIAELSQVVTKLQEQVSQRNYHEKDVSEENISMRNMEIKVEEQRKELLGKIEDAKQEYKQEIRETETNLIVMMEQKEEKLTTELTGIKEFFQENMRESERKANQRADEQKEASDQILDILLGRRKGNNVTPNVVEPKARSHCGEVR